ncbi:UvrD-helicase domain-containing protein [Desulfosarcina cetonica]|uniref:UvrD-helicase domain-containing protein n=1 Tax=Desulfosarcina cetonica TaxID=90730 RepID=UPI0006D21D1B|nr:UvrD-helicase domain-containing protein [Desulfosarcina cetonica]
MFLHEHKAIHLQGGMAVFRQAMTIRMAPGIKGRRYTQGDFKPLSVHYRERRFQVHVMVEFASLGLAKIASALGLVLDYFSLGRVRFLHRYFADRRELVERATTAESYRRIVERLGNPVQISAVGAPVEHNLLILAGPGAGKTTVIVHRCAYLLQVERIPARQILVLCFNHNAAVTLRQRLFALVGNHARGLTVVTYHGAAMRLAGISVRDALEQARSGPQAAEPIDFDGIIKDALRLLKGNIEIPGAEPDILRDQLLGGYSHILVDEYQDIDQDQYDLVSAIAGRTLADKEKRLAIMAVGDDDQNIYGFRGANVASSASFRRTIRSSRSSWWRTTAPAATSSAPPTS